MHSVDASVGQSLMFLRFARLTARFQEASIVVSTEDIVERYAERQVKDRKLDPALASMVQDLRLCIWEANYVDWVATVVSRAKNCKVLSDPSKAARAKASAMVKAISVARQAGAASYQGAGNQVTEPHIRLDLLGQAAAELGRPMEGVVTTINRCMQRSKMSKDDNEVTMLQANGRWDELYEKMLQDSAYMRECTPTQFIPFQAYITAAIDSFTADYFRQFTVSLGSRPLAELPASGNSRSPIRRNGKRDAPKPETREGAHGEKENKTKIATGTPRYDIDTPAAERDSKVLRALAGLRMERNGNGGPRNW